MKKSDKVFLYIIAVTIPVLHQCFSNSWVGVSFVVLSLLAFTNIYWTKK